MRGHSLVEILIVMAIAAAALALGVARYSGSSGRVDAEELAAHVLAIADRLSYQASNARPLLANTHLQKMVDLNALGWPVNGSSSFATHTTAGAALTFRGAVAYGTLSGAAQLEIVLDRGACVALVRRVHPRYASVRVGSVTVKPTLLAPLDLANLRSACAAAARPLVVLTQVS